MLYGTNWKLGAWEPFGRVHTSLMGEATGEREADSESGGVNEWHW